VLELGAENFFRKTEGFSTLLKIGRNFKNKVFGVK
jgi:hypothetical protein